MASPQELLERIREQPQIMIGVGVAVLGLVLFLVFMNPFKSKENPDCPALTETQKSIAKVENLGKAIEIQALLAREGLQVERKTDETGKSEMEMGHHATTCDRDRALITLVQSGLMDRNVGLEAFDKGDLTASREEKRIKLIRAQQGELARLIRKIKPVEDASVSLSIPETSIFRNNQQAMSASVQISIPSGTRLPRDQVKAIINLVVGSIQGLDAKHVALADTNGNTYNSVLDGSSGDLAQRIEDQDGYMKNKVANQLDRLVGPGHYVVTVSTQIRETTKEVMTQSYDPEKTALVSRQRFSEKLNAASGNAGNSGGPVSSAIPNELSTALTNQANSSSSSRGYNRNGEEATYANTKTQTVETLIPGEIEDISIAVTIDDNHFPKVMNSYGQRVLMDEQEFKRLIAMSASPKVTLDNVSIARINFDGRSPDALPLQSTVGTYMSAGDAGKGIPWWLWAGGVVVVLGAFGLIATALSGGGQNKVLPEQLHATQMDLQRLHEMSMQQQRLLEATQQQTQLLMETQMTQRNQEANRIEVTTPTGLLSSGLSPYAVSELRDTLADLRHAVAAPGADPAVAESIQSWVETGA